MILLHERELQERTNQSLLYLPLSWLQAGVYGFLRFVFMVEKVYNKSDRRFANILVLPKAKTQGDLRWKEKNFYRFTAIL